MNKTLKLIVFGALLAISAFAQQNVLVQTSLSTAATASANEFKLASVTGVNAPVYSSGQAGSALFIQDRGQTRGELVQVISINGNFVTVRRAAKAVAHASGAMVLVATNANWFYSSEPTGSCVLANTYVAPYLDVQTGRQYLCSASTLTWTAGWGTPQDGSQLLSGTATASAAGATAIAGPVVEVSGTNAITSFTMSVGWNGEPFVIIPTGAYTTTATNNIGKASTGVVQVQQAWVWNSRTASFDPAY